MSKLMTVLGIILLAVGLALGLLELVNPGQLQGRGISIDTAALLFVGGILTVGLGGVIAALERGVIAAPAVAYEDELAHEEPAESKPEPVAPPAAAPVEEAPQPRVRFPGFGRKAAATATAAAATTVAAAETVEAAAEPAAAAATSSVQETLDALEQAKQDIKGALGGMESMVPEEPVAEVIEEEVTVEEVIEEDEPLAEGELYVVEEKTIRGRPARVLSDNTVEAETDEGWMRFENLEHLNEYLDATGG